MNIRGRVNSSYIILIIYMWDVEIIGAAVLYATGGGG